jgi:hypothetical protein
MYFGYFSNVTPEFATRGGDGDSLTYKMEAKCVHEKSFNYELYLILK